MFLEDKKYFTNLCNGSTSNKAFIRSRASNSSETTIAISVWYRSNVNDPLKSTSGLEISNNFSPLFPLFQERFLSLFTRMYAKFRSRLRMNNTRIVFL